MVGRASPASHPSGTEQPRVSCGDRDTQTVDDPGGLARGNCSPTTQAHEHLLAIVQKPVITQLLKRASRLGQHAHALPGRRQEAGWQVAGGQEQSFSMLPPRGPRLQLRCCACAQEAASGAGLAYCSTPWVV